MREYAVLVKDYSVFISMDDKHKIKVGEPDYPVAAAERGRRVPVRAHEDFLVGDHDFTKFGIIPSVTFVINIPETISGSWYDGQAYVGFKCSVFEPSSSFRHMCELYHLVNSNSLTTSKPILFLYTDGGPDHRLTYISVQLSLISLFLKLDLDFLCACRTAPYHSWRNPVERVMSVLNLGLQCIGLARSKMPEQFEKEVSKCNTLAEIRKIASRVDGVDKAIQESLSPVKSLLSSTFSRLQYHSCFIKCFDSASTTEISEFWSVLMSVDATLKESTKYTRENISGCTAAVAFTSHCCISSHYAFSIKKCGESCCLICKPIRLPEETFKMLHHLPHPTPGEDDHYAPFVDVFGTQTSEEHRPSLKRKQATRKNTLPFYASVQHVRNIELMVQCEECGQWRLIYSKYKVKEEHRLHLTLLLDNYSYSCGSKLSDLNLPEEFKYVEIRSHSCYDPIEKLYYAAKLEPICIYCGKEQPYTVPDEYPQCSHCKDKPSVKKK